METNSSPQKDVAVSGPVHGGSPTLSAEAMRERQPLLGLRIYLVDDEAGVLRALSMVLQAFGGEIFAFPRAEEALAMLTSMETVGTVPVSTPHVIVSDLRMPGLSGIELLVSLHNQGRRIPFILMSGHATASDIAEAGEAGVDGYVPKPFTPPQLVAEIIRLVGNGSQLDSLP